VVHDWAVSIQLDLISQALAFGAPGCLDSAGCGQMLWPLRCRGVETVQSDQCIIGAHKVHHAILKRLRCFEIHWQIYEVIAASEARGIEHGAK
jgi:hypothetical protein